MKKNKDVIVNLVSPSGAGKTTIAKELEKLGYNIIKSYTTREPREESEWGHTFIQSNQVESFIGEMIAYKQIYNDHYFATKQQYQDKGISVYVVCPDGASQTKENVKDADVITIYLQCDEYIRMIRMNEDKTRSPQSISDRLEKDREVFKVCECDYVIDGNRELEKVLKDVTDIIER